MRRAILFSTFVFAAHAQFGRGGGDWMNAGADAQRSSGIRTDAKISRESLQKPGFDYIWKLKLDADTRQPFAAPVQLSSYIGYRGFRSLAFVGATSDKVVGIDTDLGRIEWEKRLSLAAGSGCGGTVALARPTNAAFPQAGGRGGFGPRGGPAKSAVGEPGEGSVIIQEVAATTALAARGPANAGGRGAAGRGGMPPGFGRMPTVVDALTADGMLHSIYVSNGEPGQPPIQFVPPKASLQGLIIVDNVAYAATGSGCASAPNAIVALDLESKNLATFKPESGALAGSLGPVFGPDGAVYVATSAGDLVALEPKTLNVRNTYNAGQPFTASPVIFEFKAQALIAGATADGALHVLDSAALKTPLTKATGASGIASLATWQDASGARWLLGGAKGAVVAWKVVEHDGAPTLESAWTSRDLAAPLAPIVVNGVVFTASTGSAPVMYALDVATGKELWNSGKRITSALHGGSISAGNSQIYLGTDDGTLYVFGFPIEH